MSTVGHSSFHGLGGDCDVYGLALGAPDDTEGKRKPGRPKAPERQKAPPRPVRLDLDVDDALCRLSRRHDVSIHALLKLAARMLVECEPDVLARRLP